MHCDACGLESAEGAFCNHCGQPLGTPPSSLTNVGAQTDGKAIGSLVCGILSLTIFSCLTGIPAIILGHMSRSAIQKSRGRLKGEGMALAGLVLGYVSIVALPVLLIIATIAIPSLLRARQAANEAGAVANLRTINAAEEEYFLTRGGGAFGDLDSLIQAGLLDDRMDETVTGYRYEIAAAGAEYTATATPASPNTGRYGYYISKDGEIRYLADSNLAPVGRAGQPIQ